MRRPDAQLVQACLAGEQSAWDELVARYGRLVYSIPRRYRLEAADADDVFQAVFLQLFRQLAALRDQERLSSWLITTAHRETWRIGRRSQSGVDLDSVISDVGTPDPESSLVWERQHLVRQGLQELGGRCERLLTALFLDPGQPDYERISQQLKIPIGSIGPTRARCFEKLEKILRRLGL